jgi:hypothetical protein
MTSRIVRVGKERQLVLTTFTPDPNSRDGLHEHVTLSTPTPLTDTARLRLLSVTEAGKRWPQ